MENLPEIPNTELEFFVSKDDLGTRLDAYLSPRIEISRRHLKELFDKDLVTVSGRLEKKSYRIEEGDHIVCQVTPVPQIDLEPREVDFEVVYEEEEWLLINKPPDLSVHPAAGQNMTTLVHGLLFRYPELHDAGEEFRPGIVHRLDRFTSGLLIVAKTNRVHHNLTDQFANRSVHKEYFAVVEGLLEYDENKIVASITRHNKQRERMMVDDSGKEAETFVRVDQRFKRHTAVNCFPRSGRRHQIRVHLSHLGHVIVGDGVYGARIPVTSASLKGHDSTQTDDNIISRLCLHARKLKFKHPLSGSELSFECPLPADIQNLISALE